MLTIEAWQLRRALRAALPVPVDDMPYLDSLHVEARGGTLSVTATDRYIAVRARVPAEGDLAPMLISKDEARVVLRLLKASARRSDRVVISKVTINDQRLESGVAVSVNGGRVVVRGMDAGGFPLKMMRKAWARASDEDANWRPVRHIALSVSVLRTLGRVLRVLKPEPTQTADPHTIWTVVPSPMQDERGGADPILIDAHGWLLILVQPRRLAGDPRGHVPFDLSEVAR